jgi:hypothetical protein
VAAVRIEDSVWKSWRYKALGQFCKMSRRWAIGIMAEVYSECTERNRELLPAIALDVMGREDGVEGFSAHLIAAQLGEIGPEGFIRIKGCKNDKGESRIDWLAGKRAAGSAGGKQSASKRQAQAKQTPSTRQPKSNPPTPAPAPSPDESSEYGRKTGRSSHGAVAAGSTPPRDPKA